MSILITPNNVVRPNGWTLEVTQEFPGCFVIKNAYAGEPCYFEGLPLKEMK